jgi:serine/threonine-protein kinase
MGQDVFSVVGTTQAGAYLVEDVVAEGGFAVVYRAHHTAFRAKVALKCLKVPAALGGPHEAEFLERFREEGELLFRLSSATPSVVRPLHVGALDTPTGRFVPFIALEWLEGRTLAALIAERRERGEPPMALERALELLSPVASALERAHRFPTTEGDVCILHRDLKPDNVFVSMVHGQEVVKILDFGIGKAKSTASQIVGKMSVDASELVAFTPAYGAPEQWLPKRFGQTGTWTDIWGLALTLVETLSGHEPLTGDPTAMLAQAIDPARRPTPRTHGVEVSDAVERLLEGALAVDPRDRPAEVGAFWRELHRASGIRQRTQSLAPPSEAPPAGNLSAPPPPMPELPDLAPPVSRPVAAPRSAPVASRRAADPLERPLPLALDDLDGVGIAPRSLPLRPRVARHAEPVRAHGPSTFELRERMRAPFRWLLLGVAVMGADFGYAALVGEKLPLGGVQPFWIAAPAVLIGVGLAFVRLYDLMRG